MKVIVTLHDEYVDDAIMQLETKLREIRELLKVINRFTDFEIYMQSERAGIKKIPATQKD